MKIILLLFLTMVSSFDRSHREYIQQQRLALHNLRETPDYIDHDPALTQFAKERNLKQVEKDSSIDYNFSKLSIDADTYSALQTQLTEEDKLLSEEESAINKNMDLLNQKINSQNVENLKQESDDDQKIINELPSFGNNLLSQQSQLSAQKSANYVHTHVLETDANDNSQTSLEEYLDYNNLEKSIDEKLIDHQSHKLIAQTNVTPLTPQVLEQSTIIDVDQPLKNSKELEIKPENSNEIEKDKKPEQSDLSEINLPADKNFQKLPVKVEVNKNNEQSDLLATELPTDIEIKELPVINEVDVSIKEKTNKETIIVVDPPIKTDDKSNDNTVTEIDPEVALKNHMIDKDEDDEVDDDELSKMPLPKSMIVQPATIPQKTDTSDSQSIQYTPVILPETIKSTEPILIHPTLVQKSTQAQTIVPSQPELVIINKPAVPVPSNQLLTQKRVHVDVNQGAAPFKTIEVDGVKKIYKLAIMDEDGHYYCNVWLMNWILTFGILTMFV